MNSDPCRLCKSKIFSALSGVTVETVPPWKSDPTRLKTLADLFRFGFGYDAGCGQVRDSWPSDLKISQHESATGTSKTTQKDKTEGG
jgi:hypothetical protein